MRYTEGMSRRGFHIPAFSVLLLMVVAAVAGLATMPLLDVQYTPSPQSRSISVSWTWSDVSERVMEAEVTSRIEGVLSGMKNCTRISSVSKRGSGRVSLSFRKGTDMAAARFEVASRIRNLWYSLPDGVSYPSISLDSRGGTSRTAVSYNIKSSLPSKEIDRYVTDYLITPLSRVDGVDRVSLWGATPYELRITFDARQAAVYGISASDIADAFNSYFSSESLGMVLSGDEMIDLKLACRTSDNIAEIPVGRAGDRIICLGEIASWRYVESQPSAYYRINGLNTVTLSVNVIPDSNLIRVVDAVRAMMEELQSSLPAELSVSLNYDASESISAELDKLYFRTILCILLLLVFVWLVNRSVRYLLLISATLAVNILVAIVFYNLIDLDIHIYTLAGITVSLGIIIDSSIVMTDHYSYYHNRSVFPAILGATATTIGALFVILLLPEKDRANLEDFTWVIIVNLSVSLLTAWLFIPSLVDRFPLKRSNYSLSVRRRRRVIRWNRFYIAYIEKGQRHRWAYIVALVAAFGLPVCLLPDEVAKDRFEDERNIFQRAYNAVFGGDARKTIDSVLGTSFTLFNKALDRSDFYREPGRDALYVSAAMPEGCTVGQLNDVMRAMENYLSLFDEIETFSTNITSYDNGFIEVHFKPEYEQTSFPAVLKSNVVSMATNFGGATWSVWGINDNYFNNNVVSRYKDFRINMSGYNYDELIRYAEILLERLEANRRVSEPEIMGTDGSYGGIEFNLEYDFGKMAAAGVSPYRYYSELGSILYTRSLRNIRIGGEQTRTVLESSLRDEFDLWHVLNSQIGVDNGRARLAEMGAIQKKRTGLPITRNNQSYEVCVGYNFIGFYDISKKFLDETLEYMNDEVLPVGYKAWRQGYRGWGDAGKMGYASLILLIIAIIYVMCSMTFESLRLPFAVILLIPVSFIGVFLIFGLSEFTFDQGGFAAFVMLSGIVVNAGIYLINEFMKSGRSLDSVRHLEGQARNRYMVRRYVKAFNHKINPIMLTIISTVLGLIPFLFDGPKEVFWFAFAVGTIAGMLFSIVALVIFLPVFCFRVK